MVKKKKTSKIIFWFVVICFIICILKYLLFSPRYQFYVRLKPQCECKKNNEIILYKYNVNDKYFYVDQLNNGSLNRSIRYNLTNEEFLNNNFTCDLYKVLKRGKSQKIIGYSLYGNKTFYYKKILKLVKQAKIRYPDWTMRVYYDSSINKNIICEAECLENNNSLLDNVDFCFIEKIDTKLKNLFNKSHVTDKLNATYLHPMMWRWFPIGDSFVDIFISRDIDSFLLKREVYAVNQWMDSRDKFAHIMRDNWQHTVVILGGMWGYFNSRNRYLANHLLDLVLKSYSGYHRPASNKGPDQDFLHKNVYQLLINVSIVHDSYLCERFKDSLPFPTKRIGNCFVGDRFDCNPNATFKECPKSCRPKDHRDWISC